MAAYCCELQQLRVSAVRAGLRVIGRLEYIGENLAEDFDWGLVDWKRRIYATGIV